MKWRITKRESYIRYDSGAYAFDSVLPNKTFEQVKANVLAYDPEAIFEEV